MTRGFWIALWLAALAAELIAPRPAVFERDAPIQGVEVVLALVGGSFAAFGLADRVEALEGRLAVSRPAGGGTTVTAELPCAS